MVFQADTWGLRTQPCLENQGVHTSKYHPFPLPNAAHGVGAIAQKGHWGVLQTTPQEPWGISKSSLCLGCEGVGKITGSLVLCPASEMNKKRAHFMHKASWLGNFILNTPCTHWCELILGCPWRFRAIFDARGHNSSVVPAELGRAALQVLIQTAPNSSHPTSPTDVSLSSLAALLRSGYKHLPVPSNIFFSLGFQAGCFGDF